MKRYILFLLFLISSIALLGQSSDLGDVSNIDYLYSTLQSNNSNVQLCEQSLIEMTQDPCDNLYSGYGMPMILITEYGNFIYLEAPDQNYLYVTYKEITPIIQGRLDYLERLCENIF